MILETHSCIFPNTMRIRKIISTLVLLVLIGPSAQSILAAEPIPWYQVEVIAFEHSNTAGIRQETWPDDPGYPKVDQSALIIPPGAFGTVRPFFASLFPDLSKAVRQSLGDLGDPAGDSDASSLERELEDAITLGSTASDTGARADTPFVLLDAREHQLAAAAQRLNNSGRYRILAHVAWRQPILKGADPILIRLYSGANEPRAYYETLRRQRQKMNMIGRTTQTDSNASTFSGITVSNSIPGDAAPLLGPPQLQAPLDGTIGVRLSRYLHLEVDLILQKRVALPRSAKASADAGRARDDLIVITDGGDRTLSDPNVAAADDIDRDLHRFRLTESRRMRSKEIHYYDHPALGVIATIMPFDPKKSVLAPAADALDVEPNEAPPPRERSAR